MWIYRRATITNFKMQLDPFGAAAAHVGYFLATFYHIPVLDVNLVTVGISAQKIGVVFDDNKLSVTTKSTSLIHNLPSRRGQNWLASVAGNINPFVGPIGGVTLQ